MPIHFRLCPRAINTNHEWLGSKSSTCFTGARAPRIVLFCNVKKKKKLGFAVRFNLAGHVIRFLIKSQFPSFPGTIPWQTKAVFNNTSIVAAVKKLHTDSHVTWSTKPSTGTNYSTLPHPVLKRGITDYLFRTLGTTGTIPTL